MKLVNYNTSCYVVLKNFACLEPLGQTVRGESLFSQEEADSIRSALKELHKSIQDVCKAGLEKILGVGAVSDPVAPTAGGRCAQASAESSGTVTPRVPKQRAVSKTCFITSALFCVVYEMKTDPPPPPPARLQGKFI